MNEAYSQCIATPLGSSQPSCHTNWHAHAELGASCVPLSAQPCDKSSVDAGVQGEGGSGEGGVGGGGVGGEVGPRPLKGAECCPSGSMQLPPPALPAGQH